MQDNTKIRENCEYLKENRIGLIEIPEWKYRKKESRKEAVFKWCAENVLELEKDMHPKQEEEKADSPQDGL